MRTWGPADGPTVLLVHGLTTPAFAWASTGAALADAGLRAVGWDQLGRGDGGHPPCIDEAALLDQMDAHAGAGPVFVVAWSWGCGLAARWAARHPGRVRRLLLLAPGGVGDGWARALAPLRTPIVGELIGHTVGRRLLRADTRRCFVHPEDFAWFTERFQEQLADPRFVRSFLSVLRNTPPDWEAAYRALPASVPVDVWWGTADVKMPFSLVDRWSTLVPHARVRPVDGGGHALHVEHPQVIPEMVATILADLPGRDPDVRATD